MAIQLGSKKDRRFSKLMLVHFVLIALVIIDVSVRLLHFDKREEHDRVGIFESIPRHHTSEVPPPDDLTESKSTESYMADSWLESSKHGMTFTHDEARADMGSWGNIIWDAMVPNGGGFVLQTNDDNSTESQPTPYGVSMFHGLHCLKVIRSKIQDLLALTENSNSTASHHMQAPSYLMDSDHYIHCLEYIAQVSRLLALVWKAFQLIVFFFFFFWQSLMCSADDTLEPAKPRFDEDGKRVGNEVGGLGVYHQCKDQSPLWRRVMESTQNPIDPVELKRGDTLHSIWDRR